MRIVIDTEDRSIRVSAPGGESVCPLYSREGFAILSREWLKVGWNLDHWRGFSWLGFQLQQLPEDVLRLQEVVCRLKPDVIVETGVFEGGSTVFFASLCELNGKGRVVSVELDVRPGLRESLAAHPLGRRITLVEGDSCSPQVFERVAREASGAGSVLVFLDSDHRKAHVAAELALYSPLVTQGSYIVAADGVMRSLAGTPHGEASWAEDNPAAAAREFAAAHPEFVLERPAPLFATEADSGELTYFPDAWLQRAGPAA
ncbi:MAG TPA: CmcI family methyltransferase [Bryobacteraceae bacterium]|nr:CmcI family methyltransferase [Bryobacteraceae bacterium]